MRIFQNFIAFNFSELQNHALDVNHCKLSSVVTKLLIFIIKKEFVGYNFTYIFFLIHMLHLHQDQRLLPQFHPNPLSFFYLFSLFFLFYLFYLFFKHPLFQRLYFPKTLYRYFHFTPHNLHLN